MVLRRLSNLHSSTVFIKLGYASIATSPSPKATHIATYKRVIKIPKRERSAMSSRRTSSRASKITEDEINNLIMKLRRLLPRLNQRRNGRVTASEVVKETCNYIRSLQSEADDLSERLSQLLGSVASDGVDIMLITNLLRQQY